MQPLNGYLKKLALRRCNESTILAAQSQPVEDAPCISRSISGPFYLYCLAGAAWRGGSGTDPNDDALHLAGRAVGNVNRRRHVYWLNGGRRTGRSLRTQKGDSAGARYLRYWLYWPVRERAAAGTIIAGDISPWPVGRLFRVSGRDRVTGGDASAGRKRKSDAGRRDYHADGTSGIGYFPDVGGHIACQRRRSLELWAGGRRDVYYAIAVTDAAATACSSAAAGKSIYCVTGGISFFARQSAYRRYCAAWRSGDDGKRGTRPLSGAGDELADVGGANRFAVCGNSAGGGHWRADQRTTGA